jgi:hypothetical protein
VAGGYNGTGGIGGFGSGAKLPSRGSDASAGSGAGGGGGGSGSPTNDGEGYGGSGGGVGLYGLTSDGTGGLPGVGVSGQPGGSGSDGGPSLLGGGGGNLQPGASGGCRIVWGFGIAFPSLHVGALPPPPPSPPSPPPSPSPPSQQFCAQNDDPVQCAALVELVTTLGAVSVNQGAPWLSSFSSFCQWAGVLCTHSPSGVALVSSLTLDYFSAATSTAATLPASFGNLVNLTSLSLSNLYNLHGPLPASLSSLASLTSLSIQNTSLTGSLALLSSMRALTELDVSCGTGCLTYGTLPNGTYGCLYKAACFDSDDEALASLAQLSSLTFLRLSEGLLSGAVPESACPLLNALSVCELGGGDLACPLPACLTNFNCQLLRCPWDGNRTTVCRTAANGGGTDDPAQCDALIDFALATNVSAWTSGYGGWLTPTSYCTWPGVTCSPRTTLYNTVTEQWAEPAGALRSALQLTFSANGLRGTLHEALGALRALTGLSISSMPQLVGSLPASLSALTSLSTLSLEGTSLSGSLGALSGLKSLTYAMLSCAETAACFTGSLPTPLPPSLRQLSLSGAQLQPLPASACPVLNSLLSCNMQSSDVGCPLPACLASATRTSCFKRCPWDGSRASVCRTAAAGGADDPAQCNALIDFAVATGWSSWSSGFGGWMTGVSYCTWAGVSCASALNTSVVRLSFSGVGLNGSLAALRGLPALTSLSIANEYLLRDTTLDFLTALPAVTDVDFSDSYNYCSIYGACFPVDTGYPRSFSGTIPQLPASLTALQLSNLQLVGALPAALPPGLRQLRITSTQVNGSVPEALCPLLNALPACDLSSNAMACPLTWCLASASVCSLGANGCSSRTPAPSPPPSPPPLPPSPPAPPSPPPSPPSPPLPPPPRTQQFCSPQDDLVQCAALADLGSTFGLVASAGWQTGLSYCGWSSRTYLGAGSSVSCKLNADGSPNATAVLAVSIAYGSNAWRSVSNGTLPASLGGLSRLTRLLIQQGSAAGQGLVGTLPASLASLPALSSLALLGTGLSGDASVLTRMPALQSLSFSSASQAWPFTGSYLTTLFGMPALTSLSVTSTSLGGSLPALQAGLTYLELTNAALSGTLPALPARLQVLNVRGNGLTGTLPALPAGLTFLDASSNALSGTLPASACPVLNALSMCNLGGNSFACPLPACLARANVNCQLPRCPWDGNRTAVCRTTASGGTDDPAQCGALIDFAVATNVSAWTSGFTGWLTPTSYCTWPGVTCSSAAAVVSLSFSNVGLSGTLPATLGALTSLSSVSFGNEPGLTGTLPSAALSALTALTSLVLRFTAMTGSLPALSSLRALTAVNVACQPSPRPCFSGALPALPPAITSLQLTGLALTGSLPALPATLWVLVVDGASLSGALPVAACPGLNSAQSISFLGTSFGCPLPSCLANLGAAWVPRCAWGGNRSAVCRTAANGGGTDDPAQCDALIDFALATNVSAWRASYGGWLSGASYCNWQGVTCPSMNVTNAATQQQARVVNASVAALTFSNVGLRGTLPASIGNLTQLTRLTLTSEPGLTGTLPRSFAALTALSQLLLGPTYLSGPITNALKSRALAAARLESYAAAGVPAFTGNFPTVLPAALTSLQVLSTQVGGALPASLPPGLQLLTVSGNRLLGGALPAALPASLLRVDLSGNNISGALPAELCPVLNAAAYCSLGDNAAGLGCPLPACLLNGCQLVC